MAPRQAKRPTAPEIRDRNTRDLLGRPGLAGLARIGGVSARGRGGGQSVLTNVVDDGPGSGAQGQLLVLSATAASIASGGDYLSFDTEVYRHGFDDAVASDFQTIYWPTSTVGSTIAVELEWDSHQGGATIEIEVDGVVPAWGVLASETSGQRGRKRRGVDIAAGSAVRIKVTSGSASAELADVFVEFVIPGRAGFASGFARQVTNVVAQRPASELGEVFVDETFAVTWDGHGTIVLSNASDGTGAILVDDGIVVDVTSGGVTQSLTYTFSPDSVTPGTPAGPIDITDLFSFGGNSVRVRCQDVYEGTVESTAIWLVRI